MAATASRRQMKPVSSARATSVPANPPAVAPMVTTVETRSLDPPGARDLARAVEGGTTPAAGRHARRVERRAPSAFEVVLQGLFDRHAEVRLPDDSPQSAAKPPDLECPLRSRRASSTRTGGRVATDVCRCFRSALVGPDIARRAWQGSARWPHPARQRANVEGGMGVRAGTVLGPLPGEASPQGSAAVAPSHAVSSAGNGFPASSGEGASSNRRRYSRYTKRRLRR